MAFCPLYLYINPIPTFNPFSHSLLFFSYLPLYHLPNPKMGDADLGLSLSFPHHHHHHHVQTTSGTHPLQLNLMIPPCLVPPHNHQQKPSSTMEDGLLCSNRNYETRAFLRVIDVNRAPSASTEGEDDQGVSSPNSTVSTISGKRNERETNPEDPDNERASSRGAMSDEEDGENCRKKLRLSKDQAAVLEESFREHNTLNPKQKQALAKQLGLRPRQVEVWFQNRRARTKLKQTEVDCEFLKRCCENLTEENRRLHKEVQELRALKLSPQFFMHMSPPTTLTMCPSCERVSIPLSSSSSSSAPDRSRPVAIAPVAYPMFDALRPQS